MAYHSFEDLDVWKRSAQLAVTICKKLSDCREYGIKDQITRSAVSIPSNIAEGADRDSIREFRRFVNIAKGSAAELRTQIYIAREINLVDEKFTVTTIQELREISAMLHGLSKSLLNTL